MKYFYGLIVMVFLSKTTFAQNEWPLVTGFNAFYGITGLQNIDDKAADQRLDPQMTMSYSGGVEHTRYFTDNFGWGVMLGYSTINQDYIGDDTLNDIKYKMYTNMSFLKINPLLHYKPYSIYYPERRSRFVCYFGPYAALLQTVEEKEESYDYNGLSLGYSKLSNQQLSFYNSTSKVNFEQPLYNKINLGGTLAIGYEMFFNKKRTASVALMLRSDVGITTIENTKKQILTDENGNKIYPNPVNPWDGLYAKFWPLGTSPIDPNPATEKLYTRAKTTPYSYSAGLSFRFYMYPEKRKVTNIFIIR